VALIEQQRPAQLTASRKEVPKIRQRATERALSKLRRDCPQSPHNFIMSIYPMRHFAAQSLDSESSGVFPFGNQSDQV
jgi:hypothetical protein